MAAIVGRVVHVLGEVDSTQAVLGRMARAGAAEGTVVTARHQTAGRGRRGHSWWDAAGESLLVSVLLRPPVATGHVPQLSLVAALAVTDALAAAVGQASRIRWPNDVLIDGAKVAGILPEAVMGPAGRMAHVVLGIGLNVNQASFPADLGGRATSLRLVTGRACDPQPLLAMLLEALDRRYAEWLAAGFAGLREAWRRRAATLGERVRTPDGRDGVAVDVGEDGALLVDTGEGAPVRVLSGGLATDVNQARKERAMLLVIEVGNTNTGVGVFDDRRLVASWRLTSRREQTADEYGLFVQTLLGTRGISTRDIGGVAISNVVPPVQPILEWMCESYFGIRPFTVLPGVNVPIPLKVDHPTEVGADRVCNVVAGLALYGSPLIVVDFGTATNFDVVNARGEFVGGAIAPGLMLATEALTSRAARLSRFEVVRPKEAIGRNTVTNLQSGVVYGYAGLVDGLVERMRAELDGDVKVVATGGLAEQMREVARSIQTVNQNLRLEGLRMIWEGAARG